MKMRDRSSKPLNTFLQCSVIHAKVSDQLLTLQLTVGPLLSESPHIFSAFASGCVTCETLSAELVPNARQERCQECGGNFQREETVLNFVIVARNLKSDCNFCHDHGSLSKTKNSGESHSSDYTHQAAVTTEPDVKVESTVSEQSASANVRHILANVADTQMVKQSEEEVHPSTVQVKDCLIKKLLPSPAIIESTEEQNISTTEVHEIESESPVDLGYIYVVDVIDGDCPREEGEGEIEDKNEKDVPEAVQRKGESPSTDSDCTQSTCYQCGKPKKYPLAKCAFCSDGGRNNECTYCEKTFGSVSSLHKHKFDCEAKANGKFLCGLCGAAFSRRYNVIRHKKKFHDGVVENMTNVRNGKEKICNISILEKSSEDKHATIGKYTNAEETHKGGESPEKLDMVSTEDATADSENPSQREGFSESAVAPSVDTEEEEGAKMEEEGSVIGQDSGVGPERKQKTDIQANVKETGTKKRKGRRKHAESVAKPQRKKAPAVCRKCGREKKYAHHKCYFCSKHVKCVYCDKFFDSSQLLKEHYPTCESGCRYRCTNCNVTYKQRYNLKRHLKIAHGGVKAYKCDLCDKSYFEIGKLKVHKRSHTGERPYQCDICGKAFRSARTLYCHSQFHKEKGYKCSLCNKSFYSKSYLKFHQSVHSEQKTYVCDICGKSSVTPGQLKRHMWTHNKVKHYQCQDCPKFFYQISELNVHRRVHTGYRPYKCSLCNGTFTLASALKRHLRSIHSTDQPVRCQFCGKEFTSKEKYNAHVKIHEERKFACELCGKRFVNATNLKSHYLTHSGRRDHACDQCDKKFRTAWYLKVHKKTHTGEGLLQCHTCGDWFVNPSYFKLHQKKFCKGNPVHCHVCDKPFQNNRELNRHMGLHTGERPYGCEVCGKGFPKPEALSEHLKRHQENPNFKCKICARCFINAKELRQHEARHFTVKRNSLLPDHLKPGNQTSATAAKPSLQSENQTSVRDQEEIAHQGTKEGFIQRLAGSDESLEQIILPVNLRPVIKYIESSRAVSVHQVDVLSMPIPGGSPADQTAHFAIGDFGEEVEVISTG